MKHVSRLGLALLAVVALAALAAVPNALATGSTAFCKVNETPCPTGSLYPAGTIIKGTTVGKDAHFTFEKLGSLTCESSIELQTQAATGAPLMALVTATTFKECELSEQACTVTAVHLPFTVDLTDTSGNVADLTETSGGTGSPGAEVKCGAVIECTYTSASPTSTFRGGEKGTAKIEAVKVPLTRSNETGKCPKTTLDATWVIQQPLPIFVSS